MAQTDTRTRILDTAEQLFAQDGYHSTSLRNLTEQANVNLAAVNYHFNSKEGLLQEVIERRLLPLNRIREEKLSAVLEQASRERQRPSVKALLAAFIQPTLDFQHSGPGSREFIKLVGRSLNEPDETVRNYFARLVMPNFQLLFEGLQKALPQLSADRLHIRLQFSMGALSHVMCRSVHPEQTLQLFQVALEPGETASELINFISAGLEAS